MSAEQGDGFVIRDRRGRTDESAMASEGAPPSQSAGPAEPRTEAPPDTEPHPPVTFPSFVFSLGASALMLMGEHPDLKVANPPVNLPQAKEIIDILSILEEKTRGNLASDEQAVLTDMLYALRIKYVDLASGTPAAKSS